MSEQEDREKYPYHRRFVRYKVRVKIELKGFGSFNTWTINVSPDGLCFEIPIQVQAGEEADAWIYISRSSKEPPLFAKCRIVWNDRTDKGFRHGAQFVAFDRDGEKRLVKWLTKA